MLAGDYCNLGYYNAKNLKLIKNQKKKNSGFLNLPESTILQMDWTIEKLATTNINVCPGVAE